MPVPGDAIRYPKAGIVVPPSLITAAENGPLVAYFYAAEAAHIDVVEVTDFMAGWTIPSFFSNHSVRWQMGFAPPGRWTSMPIR